MKQRQVEKDFDSGDLGAQQSSGEAEINAMANMSDKDIKKVFNALDHDGKNEITKEDFKQFVL